jgi:chitodextrinase
LVRLLTALAVLGTVLMSATAASALTTKGTYTDWSFPGSGYSDIDIRIEPLNDPSPAPYFWSQQFWLAGGSGGYSGLQTTAAYRPDGTRGKIAIFSIWDTFEMQAAPGGSCNTFTGEGDGASCRIAWEWVPNHIYRLRVATSSSDATGRWWSSTVRDLTTGEERLIGSIKVPAAWGLLDDFMVSFTEYWGPVSDCNQVVLARAYFHAPKANNGTVSSGAPYNHINQGGDCGPSATTVEPDGATHSMGSQDVTPPAAPAGVRAGATTTSSVSVLWDASYDNWAIANYRVYRDGVLVGTPVSPQFADAGLDPGSLYTYTVEAVDQAGNASVPSEPLVVTTPTTSAAEMQNEWVIAGSGHFNIDVVIQPNVDPTPAPYAWTGRFWFGAGSEGVTGLQVSGVRPNGSTGKVAFTSVPGAIAASGSSCATQDGVATCRLAYEWQPGHRYRLRTWTTSADATGTWWGSWVMDLDTQVERAIGSFKVPAAWGWLDGYVVASTEYLGVWSSCDRLVRSDVVFGTPTADAMSVSGRAPVALYANPCAGSSMTLGSTQVRHIVGTDGVQWVPPSAPRALRAHAGAALGSVELTWDPPADPGTAPLTSYRLYRDEGAGPRLLAELGPDATSYVDADTAVLGRYSYTVRALNPVEGPSSDGVCVRPWAPLLGCLV